MEASYAKVILKQEIMSLKPKHPKKAKKKKNENKTLAKSGFPFRERHPASS